MDGILAYFHRNESIYAKLGHQVEGILSTIFDTRRQEFHGDVEMAGFSFHFPNFWQYCRKIIPSGMNY